MIVSSSSGRGFGAFGDGQTWEDWCANRFPGDQHAQANCLSTPWTCCPGGIRFPFCAPWTDLGAGCRGIPKEGAGALYSVAKVLDTVSILDKIAVPKQMEATEHNMQVEQAKSAQIQNAAAAQQAAKQQQQQILTWAKYAGIGIGGLFTLGVVVKLLTKRAPEVVA